MMVTVISTPTASSIRLSIPTIISSTISSSSSSNLNIKASFIPSSSSSTRLILLRSKKQSKLGLIRFRKLHVSCGVTEIDQTLFTDTVLKSELPVLVEFVADWCGPCRLISPAIDWASKEYENRLKIVKINHDLNPQLIEEYKVYGLPALMFFKNGKEVPESRREGAMTKAKLKEYIDAFLESMAVV